MSKKVDSIEYEKRIRAVMEWIIEDWPSIDIINQIIQKWGILERQAKRYISDAKDRWSEDEDLAIEKKRQLRIQTLKKRQRSLKENFKGTPQGLSAVNQIEKLIIKLEGLEPAKKLMLAGDPDNPVPVPVELNLKHDLSKLSDTELQTIISISRKAVKK